MNTNDLAKQQLGKFGSIVNNGTEALTCGISGMNFVAITFLADSTFTTLTSADNTKFVNSATASTAIDTDGDTTSGITFPRGMTIYGNWSAITLATGAMIAYIGPST